MDVITTHVNADFDCLGSMIAARKLYPDAHLVFAGAQERSLREFFLRSAVYAYGFKRIRDIDLTEVTRLILVDVRQSDRIGPFEEVVLKDGVEVHIYDHHPSGKSDIHGTVEHIEPVGSTVTVLSRLLMEQGLSPDSDEATMMMLGLYEDTGGLLFNSTTNRDYEAASFLLSCGANLNTVSDFLTQEMTAEQVSLLNDLIRSRSVLNVNGVEVSIAHAARDQYIGDLAVLAHKLKDMENLNVLLVAVQMGDRTFLVGRSRIQEVHVGDILAEFGGGGHAFAASATVRNLTLIQILDRFSQVLERHVSPRWTVRQMMSSPVKSLSKDATIRDAHQILIRYGISALPVVQDGQVFGILTRQVIDKAMHHGLSNVPAAEYMTTDFETVSSKDSLELLKELIVVRNQRLVPVVDEGCLTGVVTRTDLLKHMIPGARSSLSHLHEPLTNRLERPSKRRAAARLLRDQLPPSLYRMLRDMGAVGDRLGTNVFVVGGFVRDLLLRTQNLDVDIVVEGDGIAFAEAYGRRHDARIRSHRKFGTAVIIFPDGFKVDVASARTEYYQQPGALPTVEHASIRHDLYRRDFTINTLSLSLNRKSFGEVIDFFGGQRDLKDKAVRVLHNLSFVEDPTRVFRAVRFEQRYGFHIGKHSEHLLRSAVRMGFLDKVGGSRVFNELVIILREPDPLAAVLRLAELDLLKYIHPALLPPDEIRSHFDGANRAIHWYELLYTGETIHRWQVYFLCLTADLEHEAISGICDRLDVPGRFRDLFIRFRFEGEQAVRALKRNEGRNSDVYRLLKPFPVEILLYMMAISKSENVSRLISLYCTSLSRITTHLDGDDLRRMGISPGPRYKKILDNLLDARLNGDIETLQDEIDLVKRTSIPLSSDS